jgi:NADPH:quinone reductase-like Zn-dependent oxidoreductase
MGRLCRLCLRPRQSPRQNSRWPVIHRRRGTPASWRSSPASPPQFEGLGPSHTVVFNGGGGGVGTLGIQLAKAKGAKVIAVDRAEKRDAVLALGVDSFIDYKSQDFTAASGGYDLIIDVVANRPAAHYARCLKPGGRLMLIGGTYGSLIRVALAGLCRRDKSLGVLVYKVSPEDNLALAELCLSGTLRPIIDNTFPLENGAAALRRLGSGLAVGKVVVTPSA